MGKQGGMGKSGFQYYMHDGSAVFRLELRGNLCDESAIEVVRAWKTASSIFGDRTRIIDMTAVTAVGDMGAALLIEWHNDGAQLVADSKVSREIAERAIGVKLGDPTGAGSNRSGSRLTVRMAVLAALLAIILLLFSVKAHAMGIF